MLNNGGLNTMETEAKRLYGIFPAGPCPAISDLSEDIAWDLDKDGRSGCPDRKHVA